MMEAERRRSSVIMPALAQAAALQSTGLKVRPHHHHDGTKQDIMSLVKQGYLPVAGPRMRATVNWLMDVCRPRRPLHAPFLFMPKILALVEGVHPSTVLSTALTPRSNILTNN